MKVCEECGCRVATIHLMQINGSDQKSLFLCEECAKDQGITVSVEEGFIGSGSSAEKDAAPKVEDRECPSCAMKLLDFMSTGRVGCPECYNAFSREIEERHGEISLPAAHGGKKYRPVTAPSAANLAALKSELAAAIKIEDFERAALLRDAIESLHQAERQ